MVCIILVCTCLLIVACIIICVKKRTRSLPKSNPDELSISLKVLTTSKNDTLMNNPLYSTTTKLQENPAYSITGTTLQDNPAYAGNNDTVVDDAHLYDSPQFYDNQYNEYI